jgi:hypothetical protein
MIERVARAVDANGANTEYSRRQAKAVIEAMREPTEGMEQAGDATIEWDSSGKNAWQTMIDAALKE